MCTVLAAGRPILLGFALTIAAVACESREQRQLRVERAKVEAELQYERSFDAPAPADLEIRRALIGQVTGHSQTGARHPRDAGYNSLSGMRKEAARGGAEMDESLPPVDGWFVSGVKHVARDEVHILAVQKKDEDGHDHDCDRLWVFVMARVDGEWRIKSRRPHGSFRRIRMRQALEQ